jgi:hypothetical protein
MSNEEETPEVAVEAGAPEPAAEPVVAPAKDPVPAKETATKTAASGQVEEPVIEPAKEYWPTDWREKAAEKYSAGDKKAYAKEIKRLERVADPTAIYGMYREMEGKFTSGGLTKLPGANATEQEIKDFHKAMGVPEKPEGYLDSVKLENGATIGDADKPIVESFAAAAQEAGLPTKAFNKVLNWYYENEERKAVEKDANDLDDYNGATQELKEEWGPAYQRNINAIGSIFQTAPGGSDWKNPESLLAKFMAGRLADGTLIGNSPDVIRLFSSLAMDINPAMTVTDGGSTGKGIDTEIAEIEKFMRTNRKEYHADENMRARYEELLTAREKQKARNAA